MRTAMPSRKTSESSLNEIEKRVRVVHVKPGLLKPCSFKEAADEMYAPSITNCFLEKDFMASTLSSRSQVSTKISSKAPSMLVFGEYAHPSQDNLALRERLSSKGNAIVQTATTKANQ
ncbi:hypothetical protein SPRG_03435 [Saprolegnia parasitica CBS 223.65]|uniref:Uncharacterized protein n=1 Tax=Saprolegnia parasitica (strain CBS 223.65) TaxID=695850 RepID=A0A067CLD2_SAPPC|nr:hypothetical protein SPRG_03435 [Saprolegnia parasitica CBS 223.65]KDO31509.1 hypothetical protein SPRG_03435 [Saprolegnia parasitica CBS 223.65]|eukprot:XP_012197419.1 hypothetical protein SPRG_03435 [Saprolegnia parasitica CBS 223.65]